MKTARVGLVKSIKNAVVSDGISTDPRIQAVITRVANTVDAGRLIHKGLTLERWCKFTLFEQLANVGCDIDRAIRWRKQGNMDYSAKAFERALELLTLTILDPKNTGGKRRELVRTREALIDHFVYDNEYQTTDEQWSKYFFAFNYAAAIAKGK